MKKTYSIGPWQVLGLVTVSAIAGAVGTAAYMYNRIGHARSEAYEAAQLSTVNPLTEPRTTEPMLVIQKDGTRRVWEHNPDANDTNRVDSIDGRWFIPSEELEAKRIAKAKERSLREIEEIRAAHRTTRSLAGISSSATNYPSSTKSKGGHQ